MTEPMWETARFVYFSESLNGADHDIGGPFSHRGSASTVNEAIG